MRQSSPSAPIAPVAAPDLPAALLAPLGPDVLRRLRRAARKVAADPRTVARALCSARDTTAPVASAGDATQHDNDRAVIDEELARLLAARELFMAWVERTSQEEGRDSLTPAQFLRAWGESTGRVIQLLKARRELGGGSQTDALLDAVYAELEAELVRGSEGRPAEELS